MSATREERPMAVRQSTFVWAVGLLAGMIVACVGWSFAAYTVASDAEKKVLELEIRLNKVDSALDNRLSLIEQHTRAISESLKRHEEDTRTAASRNSRSRSNQRDMDEAPQ